MIVDKICPITRFGLLQLYCARRFVVGNWTDTVAKNTTKNLAHQSYCQAALPYTPVWLAAHNVIMPAGLRSLGVMRHKRLPSRGLDPPDIDTDKADVRNQWACESLKRLAVHHRYARMA